LISCQFDFFSGKPNHTVGSRSLCLIAWNCKACANHLAAPGNHSLGRISIANSNKNGKEFPPSGVRRQRYCRFIKTKRIYIESEFLKSCLHLLKTNSISKDGEMKVQSKLMPMIICCLVSTSAAADTVRERIHTTVLDHLNSYYQHSTPSDSSANQRIEIRVDQIDPRLTLPDCSQPLQASLNNNQRPVGKVSVKVQCQGLQPWSKYVPAEVHVIAQVLVANRNLRRGSVLSASDLDLVEMDLAVVRRTAVSNVAEVVGMELKQAISTGSPVVMESLAMPVVIKRGDLVQILAETGSITIRQQGEALQDGEIGKLINVRNSSSQLVIQAIVVNSGQTKIQL